MEGSQEKAARGGSRAVRALGSIFQGEKLLLRPVHEPGSIQILGTAEGRTGPQLR